MAKMMSCRPSSLLDISDPLTAFVYDRAVFTFGTSLQSELNQVEGKNRSEMESAQDRIFRRWLPETASAQKFADPGAATRKGS